MTQNIITEQRQNNLTGQTYWLAWLEGFKDNYSLGDTEAEAISYLKRAINLRSDIYGSR